MQVTDASGVATLCQKCKLIEMKSAVTENKSNISVYRKPELEGIELLCVSNAEEYEPHFHSVYTIGMLTCGSQKTHIGKKVDRLYTPSVLFLEPYQVHANLKLTDDTFSFRQYEITPEKLRQILEGKNPPGIGSNIEDPEMYKLLYRTFDVLTNNDSELGNDIAITTTLTRMFHNTMISKPINISSKSVDRVREYLHAEYVNQITLDSLADMMQISRVHVSRLFKKYVGIAPHEYLIQLRVDGAKIMLAEGTPPIEAAIANGFTDQSHLNRHFKRIIHMTPAAYARSGYKRTRF